MPSVFEVLSRDHAEVKQLLSELESGPTPATGASPDLLALRKNMAETLVIKESKHEAAEAMHIWPTVRERLPDGGHLADRAISQEQEGKEVLAKLDKAEADDPEFEALLSEFIAAGRDHIAFEESQVWPALQTRLTEAEAGELGGKIEQAKKTGPTRPHPHTPAVPGGLKSAGPVATAVGRARDVMTDTGN